MTRHGRIEVTRIYQHRSPTDGCRVLVDRLWPRGLTAAEADIDEWCRSVAPSASLRRWYGHCETRFAEFRDRYLLELDDPAHAESLMHLRAISHDEQLTLLTATEDLRLSNARVLAERLSWGRATKEPATVRVHINQRLTQPNR